MIGVAFGFGMREALLERGLYDIVTRAYGTGQLGCSSS